MSLALITGFEPFGDFRENPAQQIAEQLHGQTIGDIDITSLILPVTYGRDTDILFPAIEELQPQLVLSLGLAARATCLQVERIALNLRNAEIADGQIPILADAPAAYFATIDVDSVASAICRQSIPAQPHVYAGTYLCNHVMYQALHLAATRGLSLRSGFIHLPLSHEQVIAGNALHMPSMPLQTMVDGVSAAIKAALS